jgi:hypothetical protein
VDSSEHKNESKGSTKGREYLDKLNDYCLQEELCSKVLVTDTPNHGLIFKQKKTAHMTNITFIYVIINSGKKHMQLNIAFTSVQAEEPVLNHHHIPLSALPFSS